MARRAEIEPLSAELMAEPRWAQAAQALVDGCIDLPSDDERVALLAVVCDSLGDELYPAFLRLLALIGRLGNHAARAAVAQALVHALRTGRLPSGRRSAWGAEASSAPPPAYGHTRSLGPLEYLCAWHAQADAAHALGVEQFHVAAHSLMNLIASSDDARKLYCDKLLADVDDPIAGALSRPTRHALRELALAWAAGADALDASTRFVNALPPSREASLASRIAQPAYALR
ncbi:MAG: hypothetical protein IT503_05060 [Burkholderiaceae bacterium]|nr:MAG: hypothetical protein F9K36_03235 [Burkholderiaceae bacterium]MCC7285531.1 hypothetical protein [Burkholderiaceae bacterium]